MKVCIIIPMYNEEHIARKNLETILSYTRKPSPETTVVIINDCSRDNTEAIVQQVIAEQPDDHLRLISHTTNRGYGAANRTGSQYAIEHGYDYVLFMDSDLTNHPKYLAHFYRLMESGYDYIKASRYIPGGKMEGVPWSKQVISRLGNLVASRLFGLPLHDCTNGFRAVKTDILRGLRLTEDKFALIMEELYQAKGAARTFAEVPYILTARLQPENPSSFTYRPSVFWVYLKYAMKSFLNISPRRKPIEHDRKEL